MNIISNFIPNLIFYFELILFTTGVVSVRTRSSWFLIVHSLIVLIVVFPLYLGANDIPAPTCAFILSDACLILFPLSFAFIFSRQIVPLQEKKFIALYAVTLLSFISYLVFPECRIENIYVLHMAGWSLILFYCYRKKPNLYAYILYAVCLCNIAAVGVLFFLKRDSFSIVASSGILNIVTFLIILFFYITRIIDASSRFEKIHEMNKRLTHNVTRLKISNEQIRKIIMQKDLELLQLSRHASLAEITTGIAHELSQPLTGIKGIAQNMIDDINYDDFDNLQAVSELHKISSLVDKSSSIIDHIRNFSKKSIFTMKNADLNSVVLDAIDLVQNQIKKNNIDLVFILDENIPRINGNTVSLEQMIVNFILNARDAIIEKKLTSESLEGHIHVATTTDDTNVVLNIEDNGTGIPDDILQKIWSPFFTTKTKGQGTGIGLSICSRIIREHNAIIDIKTSKKGTSFIIKFPVNSPSRKD
ncbi:MAG TPA: ATP-binding protein [Spirochaetota bacterium]|nr:ATP-binding protein [Spirochaetota bacterium]HPI90836.1 ATP-binding protein [Spirochaetota bacterium]HPR47631.1 ATP-binding protein [Spirochaetota bacterium]